jgi:hypothetical protein
VKTLTLAIVAVVLAGCGGSHVAPPPSELTGPGSHAQKTATVTINITLPAKQVAAHQRSLLYISTATSAVNVVVAQGGAVFSTGNITCAGGSCNGSVTAPIGSDTFTVTLLNASGTSLSIGTKTQSIVAGTNTVSLTFNPVVHSVQLALDASNPVPPEPLLVQGGNTGVLIDVTAYDASNATIVGPGAFVDSSGNAVTIGLQNSDVSGATTLSPGSFTTAQATALQTTLNLVRPSVAPPFDVPTIVASAQGQPFTSNSVRVPLSPFAGTNAPAGSWTSVYNGDATDTAKDEVVFNIGSGANPLPAGSVGEYPSNLTGGTSDGLEWLLVYYGTSLEAIAHGGAMASAGSNVTQGFQSITAGSDGYIWFVTQEGGSGMTLYVGKLTSPGGTVVKQLLPSHLFAWAAALVPGPSGTMLVVQNDGTNSWIDQVPTSLSGTVTEASIVPAIANVNIAGYAQHDGNMYVVDGTTAIFGFGGNPQGAANLWKVSLTGSATLVAANTHLLNQDPNNAGMSELNDGTLAYTAYDAHLNDAIVHVIPGQTPGEDVLYLSNGSAQSFLYWSITPGGNVTLGSIGNTKICTW